MFSVPLFVECLLCVLIEMLSFIYQESVERPRGYECLSTIRGAPTVCRMLRLCAFVCQVSVGDLLCVRCFRRCSEQDRGSGILRSTGGQTFNNGLICWSFIAHWTHAGSLGSWRTRLEMQEGQCGSEDESRTKLITLRDRFYLQDLSLLYCEMGGNETEQWGLRNISWLPWGQWWPLMAQHRLFLLLGAP